MASADWLTHPPSCTEAPSVVNACTPTLIIHAISPYQTRAVPAGRCLAYDDFQWASNEVRHQGGGSQARHGSPANRTNMPSLGELHSARTCGKFVLSGLTVRGNTCQRITCCKHSCPATMVVEPYEVDICVAETGRTNATSKAGRIQGKSHPC